LMTTLNVFQNVIREINHVSLIVECY